MVQTCYTVIRHHACLQNSPTESEGSRSGGNVVLLASPGFVNDVVL